MAVRDRRYLFDLARDPSEENDLPAKKPDKLAELTELYDRWLDDMAEPLNKAPKRWKPGAPGSAKPSERRKRRLERQKTRQAPRRTG